jgi:hypothetical protein
VPARIYRYPASSIAGMAVCAVFFAALAGLALYARRFEPGIAIDLCLCGFALMAGYTGWLTLQFAVTRVELGYDWIRKRTPFGTLQLAFSDIAAFSEVRRPVQLGRHGAEFRLHARQGPRLTFTTQLVGWAAIVEGLHQVVPWHVPAASALHSRRTANDPLVEPYSAAFFAPGQPLAEEWARPGRIGWRDMLICQLAALLVVIALVVVVVRGLQAAFGYHAWVGFVLMLVAVVGSQALGIVFASRLRRYRLRRARRNREFGGDDAERVISPGFAERQRRP